MLDLKFIGRGSAFNTKMGNNSAYFKVKDSLVLIDCGSETFSKLKENEEIIKGIKNCYIIITHLHPDHVGSLGDYIFYNYFCNEGLITHIMYPEPHKLEQLLTLQGVRRQYYTLNNEFEDIRSDGKSFILNDPNLNDCTIYSHSVKHMDNISSFAYCISDMDEGIYYSGDTYELKEFAYKALLLNNIDRIYQDTCLADYPNNVHANIDKMYEQLKDYPMKDKIYCMHLDDEKILEKIKQYGFNHV